MVQIEQIIIVIISIYTFISESLPFIKDIESNGIIHALILFINKDKHKCIQTNIEQPNNDLEEIFNNSLNISNISNI